MNRKSQNIRTFSESFRKNKLVGLCQNFWFFLIDVLKNRRTVYTIMIRWRVSFVTEQIQPVPLSKKGCSRHRNGETQGMGMVIHHLQTQMKRKYKGWYFKAKQKKTKAILFIEHGVNRLPPAIPHKLMFMFLLLWGHTVMHCFLYCLSCKGQVQSYRSNIR